MLSSELTPMVAPRASLDAPIAATCYSLKATLKGSSKDSDLVFVVHQRGEGYNKRRSRLVEKVCQYISDNPETTLSLQQLSARFKVSSSHLQRLFTVTLGVSPREFQETCRIEALKRMPRKGSPVTSAIFNSDFGSVSRVYEKINVHLGMTPSTYSHGGRGVKRRRSNMPHCQPDRF